MDYKQWLRPWTLVLVGMVLVFLDQALGVIGMGAILPSWVTGVGAAALVIGALMQLFRKKKQ